MAVPSGDGWCGSAQRWVRRDWVLVWVRAWRWGARFDLVMSVLGFATRYVRGTVPSSTLRLPQLCDLLNTIPLPTPHPLGQRSLSEDGWKGKDRAVRFD